MSNPVQIRDWNDTNVGRTPLLDITDSTGQSLLRVPAGSYLVAADGWRGRMLTRLARILYWHVDVEAHNAGWFHSRVRSGS